MADDWQRTVGPFSRYLLSCDKSPETVRTYCSGVKLFWQWCAQFEMTPYEARKQDLRDWIASRLQVVGTSRVHNDVAGIHWFYAWLKEISYREDDPSDTISIKRRKTLPTKPLATDELSRILDACGDERERLMILVMASTGARISEVAALQTEWIDWQRGVIKIVGKGEKERLLAPAASVLERLHVFLGMFPAPGPVFLSKWGRPLAAHQIRKILYRIGDAAKIDHIHPHRLRSLFATEFMEQFGDIQALQVVMGHESIETTARYSEWTRERRGLAQMRKLDLGTRAV